METLTFAGALAEVSAIAHAKLPESLHGRLEMATALVHADAVWLEEDGHTVQVRSTDDPTRWYQVNGVCPCPDAVYRAPDGWCKHKLGAALRKRTVARLEEEEECYTVDLAPEGLPPVVEVPAIMSTTLTIAGRQVEVKLCDTDDARLLARLTALLEQFPVPQSAPGAPAEGWCATHAVQMKWNAGQDGKAGWWSHKNPEGQWCKGKRGRP